MPIIRNSFYPQGKKTLHSSLVVSFLIFKGTSPTSGQVFDTVHLRNRFTSMEEIGVKKRVMLNILISLISGWEIHYSKGVFKVFDIRRRTGYHQVPEGYGSVIHHCVVISLLFPSPFLPVSAPLFFLHCPCLQQEGYKDRKESSDPRKTFLLWGFTQL